MLGSIRYNLAILLNFKGCDARQTFWFCVLFLVILQYAAGMLISLPMMGGMMKGAFIAAMTSAPAGEMASALAIQSRVIGASAMSWAAILIVIICGVLPSTNGPNRYGDAPVRF